MAVCLTVGLLGIILLEFINSTSGYSPYFLLGGICFAHAGLVTCNMYLFPPYLKLLADLSEHILHATNKICVISMARCPCILEGKEPRRSWV